MAESGAIRVNVSFENGVAVVAPVGDLGTHEAPALRQSLKEAAEKRPGRVVVDLSGVSYMATSGLATLVEALRIAKDAKSRLVLCGMQPRVKAVFEISRLTNVFTIVDTKDAAMTS